VEKALDRIAKDGTPFDLALPRWGLEGRVPEKDWRLLSSAPYRSIVEPRLREILAKRAQRTVDEPVAATVNSPPGPAQVASADQAVPAPPGTPPDPASDDDFLSIADAWLKGGKGRG
jgi:hypothetical protein